MWSLTYPRKSVHLSISRLSSPLPLLIVSHVVFSRCMYLPPSMCFSLLSFLFPFSFCTSSLFPRNIFLQTSLSPALLFLTLLFPFPGLNKML